jgi:hypothetical protein
MIRAVNPYYRSLFTLKELYEREQARLQRNHLSNTKIRMYLFQSNQLDMHSVDRSRLRRLCNDQMIGGEIVAVFLEDELGHIPGEIKVGLLKLAYKIIEIICTHFKITSQGML